ILLALTAAFAVVGIVMGRYVNINRFSLHSAYRDRLIRAYLGASRSERERQPNPFTGFDENDNIQMRELRAQRRGDKGICKPLHVVNMTLNLVGGKKLAWQNRKAESFTVTPLYCGSYCVGYRDSDQYGR